MTETIHYVYQTGTEAAPDYTTSLEFSRLVTTDEVTGKITHGDWTSANNQTSFAAVMSPDIAGYIPDKAEVNSVTGLRADSRNLEYPVTYTKEPTKPKPPIDVLQPTKKPPMAQKTSSEISQKLPVTGDAVDDYVLALGAFLSLTSLLYLAYRKEKRS